MFFFPRDVFDEIWNVIGSVSEGFPTYFFIDILDTNKASGPDLISNKMIKNVSEAIAIPLCIIFNRSLFEGIFPDIWKLSNLVPLFKKEKR